MDKTIDTSMGTGGAEPYATMPAPATVRIERILPGPVERIWAYITDSDKRRKWFAEGPMVEVRDRQSGNPVPRPLPRSAQRPAGGASL